MKLNLDNRKSYQECCVSATQQLVDQITEAADDRGAKVDRSGVLNSIGILTSAYLRKGNSPNDKLDDFLKTLGAMMVLKGLSDMECDHGIRFEDCEFCMLGERNVRFSGGKATKVPPLKNEMCL